MVNLNDLILSHKEVLDLQAKGILLPSLRTKKTEIKINPLPTSRQILARTLHKAIRQFELEGCPNKFDLSIHIDQMIHNLKEAGYILNDRH
jgi:hypothetical protein